LYKAKPHLTQKGNKDLITHESQTCLRLLSVAMMQPLHRHAGEGRHPGRQYEDASRILDTGLRRYDEYETNVKPC
jgi:hypothetical protein